MGPIRRGFHLVLTLVTLGFAPWCLAAEPTVDELLAEGNGLLERRQASEAIRLFRKAAKAGQGQCAECELALSRAYRTLGAFKDAEEAANRALAIGGDEGTMAMVNAEVGLALLATGKADDGSALQAAEHFKTAIELDGDPVGVLRFNHGFSLLKAGRDDEGKAALQKLVDETPHGPFTERARGLIEEPRRAREALLPQFSGATLDGRFVTHEDLAGKVVLLDFWGTWCPPCRAAIPNLKRLHKQLKGQPFELIGVVVNDQREVVTEFVAKEGVGWTQIFDEMGAISRDAFQVTTYPTYLLIDPEGAILMRESGWSPRLEAEVTQRVRRAVSRARKTIAASQPESQP